MPSQCLNVPTISANENDMKEFIKFIYKYESILKKYGAIKIVPPNNFKTVFKKKIPINISSCSTIQQVKEIDNENLIYLIKTIPMMENKQITENISINEQTFWLLLPNNFNKQEISSISSLNNRSLFLKRVHRTDFDFHELPFQSLLKLCGKKNLNQFSSSLIKAHGPAAIFPLSSNEENLFQFNYHYEGGIRYWYIIPSKERIIFENILKSKQPSICLEHDKILIDPLMFHQYKINYHKIIQYSNEIVILSSGILSQSFTENEMLCESINFALPSWFYDRHIHNYFSCKCELSSISKNKFIDMSLFNNDTVQKYINKYLETNINQSIIFKQIYFLLEKVFFPDNNSFLSLNCELDIACSSIDNIHEKDFSIEICDESIDLTKLSHFENETNLNDNNFNELFSLEDVYEEVLRHNNNESQSLTFEQILNIINTSSSNVQPTEEQFQNKNNHETNLLQIPNQNEFVIKKYNAITKIDLNKILYISNLNKQVTKNDLRSYFIGSTKILLKQSRLPPYLNYAFIFHRTNLHAEHNRKRPLHSSRFGSNCEIKYAKNISNLSNESETCEKWNIVVKKIPENVTEECLKNIFFNCQQIKYIPARIIKKTNTTNKILLGYAFLFYANAEQAADVVKNAEKYQINNQSLKISFYNRMERQETQTKRFNSIH